MAFNNISRRSTLASLAAYGLQGILPNANAQTDWPTGKTITYVVPYPPAGSTDILGRAIAQRLAMSLGTQVVVDNKAGATGTIGGALVAKAAPDGYTVLGTSIGPQSIAPHLMGKLPYEPLKDLAPVILVGTIPHVLVVAASQPTRTVAELLATAKAKPEQVSFASGGNGTILHMQGELLAMRNNVRFNHIPYKGDTPAVQDTLSGQVQFMFAPAAAATPHILSGKLRALAVTSAARLKALPNVPTMLEAGQKDFVVEQWQAIYLPAQVPVTIVNRLNSDINKALREPSVMELADKLGVTLVGGTPGRLAQQQSADSEVWARVIRTANIKAE